MSAKFNFEQFIEERLIVEDYSEEFDITFCERESENDGQYLFTSNNSAIVADNEAVIGNETIDNEIIIDESDVEPMLDKAYLIYH